ncbi:MAG: sigma 54-interacting transcriptional regulator [Bacteroidales bacterium]|nr:sigma 54-interacting transcriptional regulator [Bacteroidales bacterium]MDT8432955.1 sigma 54-interacting transcriptional regulator [Bacteroidales bacterium]
MAKILMGWLAVQHDFTKPRPGQPVSVDHDGPNYQYHKHFFEGYDKHILLHTGDRSKRMAPMLHQVLKADFPGHQVELLDMNVVDVISLEEVKPKVEKLLLDHKEDEVDIFFSPGTSIMQLSWYICHTSLGMQTRLLQTVGSRDRKGGDPVRKELVVEKSLLPYGSYIKQQGLDQRGNALEVTGFKLTDSIKPVYSDAQKIASADHITCLITGPTGTGKEHLAQYIRDHSPRHAQPFEKINCSALGDELLESRLFGYRKGAFTGAADDHDGIFKRADNGTVFLDEVGDISPRLQQSLLRLLQEGEIQPIGGAVEKVNVRILAATNKDLVQECEAGNFRWDLYYRLAVTELVMPSLASRGPDEIDELFEFFLDEIHTRHAEKERLKPDPEVIQFVKSFPWPGNIRQLEHFVENLYVFCDGQVTMEDIPERFTSEPEAASLKIEDVEAMHIRKVLKMKRGNQRQTALAIGWVINTLRNKMDEYGIDAGDYK